MFNCVCICALTVPLLFSYLFHLLAVHPLTDGSCPLLELAHAPGFSLTDVPDLTSKTVLVTGANSGLGLASARIFAKAGATVLLTCRSQSKCQDATEDILKATGARLANVRCFVMDISSLSSVRAGALDIRQNHPRLDVVMLNAGVQRAGMPFEFAKDSGVELTLATNHLGHFLLVDLLMATLGQGSRVVVVSSCAHYIAPFHGVPLTKEEAADPGFYVKPARLPSINELQPASEMYGGMASKSLTVALSNVLYYVYQGGDHSGYSPMSAYATSKFANVLHAQGLAKRLQSRGAWAFATHPGFVKTSMADFALSTNAPNFLKPVLMPLIEIFCLHRTLGVFWLPEAGAMGQVFAATSPAAVELPSGSYVINTGRLGTKDARLQNRTMQEIFWKLSEELVSDFRDE